MLTVIVDSNIWISALLVSSGKSRELVARLASGAFVLSYPTWLLDEIRKTSSKPRLSNRIQAADVANIISLIEEQGILVEPTCLPSVSRDPKDDVFLACALESHADFIVTGDDDLLVLGEYHGTQIVTVSRFLEILTNATT
ncbi:putative toxin-antitoxin system toxin component, PIN family [soil metagenome]